MPVFPTPEPINVTIDRIVGDVRFVATDRTDTSVEVRPADPSRAADIRGAEKTQVDFSAGRLTIKGHKQANFIGKLERVDITIELPSGSALDGNSDMGNFTTEGPLGAVRLKTAMGDIRLDETKDLYARTSMGTLLVERVDGDADVATGSGELRIGRIAGSGLIKNSNGDIAIDEAVKDLLLKSANGHIRLDRTHSSVTAKTANGNIRIGEVAGGAIQCHTAAGNIEIGIRPGTAAWLELSTSFGAVHNSLDPAASPQPSEAAVEVTARTSYGDIVISRSTEVTV